MADARLGILISADTAQAEAGLKKLNATVEKTGGIVRTIAPQVSKLGDTIETLRAKALARKEFLLTETDITKVGQYNREIKQLESEISRLQTIGTQAFSGVGKEATKAFSALRQIAFIVPGIGIAGIFNLAFTAISDVVGELFNLTSGFSSSDIAGAKFGQTLDNISDSAEKLKKRLDFQDDIAKLKAQLSGLKGQELTIVDLIKRTQSATELITAEEKVTQTLSNQKKELQELAKQMIETGVASEKFKQIAFSFPSGQTIPKSLISGLPKSEQAFANQYVEIIKNIEDSQKRSSTAQEAIGENSLRIQIEQQEKEKAELDKRKSNWERYVNETISRGKELSDHFKDIKIVPQFSFLDTKQEQLKKALSVIKGFEAGTLEIKFSDILAPSLREDIIKEVRERLKQAKDDLTSILNAKIELPNAKFKLTAEAEIVLKETQKNIEIGKDLQKQVADAFNIRISPEGLNDAQKKLFDIQNQGIIAAQSISDVLTPAFQDLFTAIQQGEDPLKAFFKGIEQSVTQLIQKLIAAAVQALILSAIFPGGVGGAKGFGALFGKLLGFAEGGRPPVGKESLGGEIGKELWIPDIINKNITTISKQTILTNKPAFIGGDGPQLFKPTVPGVIVPHNKISTVMNNIRNYFSTSSISNLSNKAFSNITSPLSKIFNNSIMKREGGGPVFPGISFLGGERGQEVFIPASLIQQPQKTNLSGLTGSGMQNIAIEVFGRLSGNDILLSGARQSRSNNRNG